MNVEKFKTVTGSVISLLEGGYFHPNMFTDGRVNPKFKGVYENSGETMFGLDRHAGHDLYYLTPRRTANVQNNLINYENDVYVYKTPQAREFWQIIDADNAKDNWKFNFTGGINNTRLKNLAAEILFPVFQKYFITYLTPPAQKIVENSPTLLFHFVYSVWNGSGFFKYYAEKINKAIAQGETNADELTEIINQARLNSSFSTIRNTGKKIIEFFNSITWETVKKKLINPPIITGVLVFAVAVAAFFYLKRK